MYKIIGADGREYGPVTPDQVRQWIKEGRANAQTRVLPEGASEWRSLDQVAEFISCFAASSPEPTTPPMANAGLADAMAEEILRRDYTLEIGSCISRGWELLKANFWLTVGASAITMLLIGAMAAVPFLGGFAAWALGYVLTGGLLWFFLRMIRGQRPDVGDVFAGFSLAFVPLMLYSLVGQLLSGIGFLLCILPGIYLTIAWQFAGLLIIDKRLDFWPAMELSRKVVTRHFWSFLGLAIISFLLVLLGLLACLIGQFVAYPVIFAASVFAYEDLFGSNAARRPSPTDLLPVQPRSPMDTAIPVSPVPGTATPAPAPFGTPAEPAAPAQPTVPVETGDSAKPPESSRPADPGPQI